MSRSATLQSALNTYLQKTTDVDGIRPNQSQDPINTVLHNYFVFDFAKTYFDKRRKDTLDYIKNINSVREQSEYSIDSVLKYGASQTLQAIESEDYSMNLMIKSPAEIVDKIKLRTELVKAGISTSIIDQCFAAATKRNKPAEVYTIVCK